MKELLVTDPIVIHRIERLSQPHLTFILGYISALFSPHCGYFYYVYLSDAWLLCKGKYVGY